MSMNLILLTLFLLMIQFLYSYRGIAMVVKSDFPEWVHSFCLVLVENMIRVFIVSRICGSILHVVLESLVHRCG